MKGIIIQEAYFLDIKKYGYWYFDKDGNRIEKSTIAGVERNTVSFKDIESLAKGDSLTKTRSNVFYKNLDSLSIEIKDINITVSDTSSKSCVDNKYIPINIVEVNHKFYNVTLFIKLKNKILGWFRKFK